MGRGEDVVRRGVRCNHVSLEHDIAYQLPFYRILSAIDAGSDAGGASGRLWTIDPIDGTLGFLRKEQYAVCLALIVDGQVELGLLACPNLGTNSVDDQNKGVLFLARKGEGSWSVRPEITRIPWPYSYLRSFPLATHRRERIHQTDPPGLNPTIIHPIPGIRRVLALRPRYPSKDRLDSRCTRKHELEDG